MANFHIDSFTSNAINKHKASSHEGLLTWPSAKGVKCDWQSPNIGPRGDT